MATVFDQKLYEAGDTCWAIVPSVTEPHLYTRFKCIVHKKEIRNDSINYYLKIVSIEENDEWIKNHIHRKHFRLFHIAADRGQIKELNCFDLLLNMTTFQRRFSEKFKEWVLVVPSVHISDNKETVKQLCEQTIEIMLDRIDQDIKDCHDRKKRLELEK